MIKLKCFSISMVTVVAMIVTMGFSGITYATQTTTGSTQIQVQAPPAVPEPPTPPEPEPEPEWPAPPIPRPPVDVCPNLPGDQDAVPEGYYLDLETDACRQAVPPTAEEDVCLNLAGVQATTPSGMINDNGYCYTPEAPIIPPTSEEPPLKNVPDFLQPFAQFLVDLVPEPVREFFRQLPEGAVDRIPLYIFVLALIFVLIPILQSIREYLYRRRLMALYRREQGIAEEKDNFMTIASHYLRTPMAIMRDTIPLMAGTGIISSEKVGELNGALQTLGSQVSTSIDAVNADSTFSGEAGAPEVAKPKPFWRSGFFWLPIVLSIVLTVLVNFFIGVVGEKEIGTGNAVLQLIIVVGFIVALYLVVRNYHIQKHLRQENDALIAHEQVIDSVRNDFLGQQATNISAALGTLYFASPQVPAPRAYDLYADGLSRLSGIHDKFILLSQVRTGADRATTAFVLSDAINQVVGRAQSKIVAKNLNIQVAVGDIPVTQNESLFSFVISSVLDNAVKFSEPGGHIVISAQPTDKTVMVRVSDNGRGIDPSKIDQLFKPFSRAESAVDFAYEGLGLSLFLDRLILTYTGGDISIAPRDGGGTDVTITTPVG